MNDESQKEKLRQHFARRVTTQARVVLDTWQKIRDDRSQAPAHRDDLIAAADKLVRYARRFEMDSHAAAGELILSLLTDWHQDTPLDDAKAKALEDATENLRLSTQRRTDQDTSSAPQQYRRTPVYIALSNEEMASRLIRQLEFFGFRASAFSASADLIEACALSKPETILMDVSFGGRDNDGIATVEQLQ